ncbi:golgin subfamily A member 4-like isoform X2 [Diachasmimorpha longicaudata]|uniref:golgin subfamily A member 4-like isoform X2 n=1 Tax=Diachasmimorpha longicaudata TaxID=58733 RepID=UPI0030B8FCD5
MDGDERRASKRRSLEAGREILARYKASQGRMDTQGTDPSDVEESFGHNETIDTQNSSLLEDASLRDTTQSSMSVSEGEGEGDIENMAGRVAELKELLQGKEAMIESLSAEIDHMRGEACSPHSSQSQSSSQYRDLLTTYQHKLQDFEQAVAQRDNLITELTSSLEQALASRDALKDQVQFLNSLPILNPPQKGPEEPRSPPSASNLLEETIKQLNAKLQILEDEKTQEIKSYKCQINELNQRIQSLEVESTSSLDERQKVQELYDAQISKIKKDMEKILDKFAVETKQNAESHHQEIINLGEAHEKEVVALRGRYEEQVKGLQDSYNLELVEVEKKHAKELSVFQSQLASYKKTIEGMKSQMESHSEGDKGEVLGLKNQLRNAHHERELLVEQIKLHKIQVEELTAKYVAATTVFDSKESIEKSLEEALTNVAQLTQENENLKLRYDDLSAKYSAAQALIENNQIHERSMSSRIYELERSLGRMSGVNNSLFSELNETTYQTFDDLALQIQLSRQKLEEKEELERKLTNKIKHLEETVLKTSKELEDVNLQKNNYEKQLKDLKNSFDKMINSDNSSSSTRMKQLENELEEMKDILRKKDLALIERDRNMESLRAEVQQLENDCRQLMGGLQAAWNQCAERELKMSESLMNESKLGPSGINLSCVREDLIDATLLSEETFNHTRPEDIATTLVGGINSAFNRYENLFSECEKLCDVNNQLRQDLESVKLSLEHVAREKEGLLEEVDNLKEKHRQEIEGMKQQHTEDVDVLKKLFGGSGEWKEEMEGKHAQEMEELRTYFEQKVLHVEKQYSEEIFSQSKKLSDDSSEVEDMTDDLYFGGGGDAENLKDGGLGREVLEQESKGSCDKSRGVTTSEQHSQTELEPMENGELSDLRAAYSVQLEEQIALARCDIVNALQEQIQVLLAVEGDPEENWPPELLQLRNKFTNNARREVEKLKESHQIEISKLKEEYTKALENYESEMKGLTQRRMNYQFDGHLSSPDDVVKQRYESLHKICFILKGLVVDLIKYTVTCEEELNNTFITEIIKRRIMSEEQNSSNEETDKNPTISEREVPDISTKKIIKRVHFAPQSQEISSIINSETDSLLSLIEEEEDIGKKLRDELEKCLERLRSESAEIISASSTPGESTLEALSKQVLWTTKVNEELSAKLMEAEGIVEDYQVDNQQLKMKIIDLQQKISVIEGAKEIISEGYGEQDEAGGEVVVQDFSQLLEKARLATVNAAADPAYHLQLIEELCRCTEKILEDSKREKEDLQQQVSLDPLPSQSIHRVRDKIDAADKQLRSTRKFLEEQASEREMERDEAAKQIKSLHDQLKERERDKERDLRISSESPSPTPDSSLGSSKVHLDYRATVEALEHQMREMTSQISDTEQRKTETESELKAAVDKIWVLRDIIMDLEQQIQSKIDQEEVLVSQITHMKEVISSQTITHQELVEELDQLKSGAENIHLLSHISHLQTELQRHQLSNEQFTVNSTALKQMKSELREMQNNLDKRIKELEALHMTGSNLSISQPSEDVSIRDQIDASRCPTPDEDGNSPLTLPLDQLLKLKEKLLKHSRTEEVAFKKIKDLDMQLSALKIQNEELQEERDILQQTTSDQLFQIEQMRGRLEQYKQSAPFAQRQATSRLELELHEVNSKVQSLEQRLSDKDLELKEMRSQLERANLLLKEKEEELNGVVHREDNEIIALREKLEVIEHEKQILESKLSVQERAQQEFPQLIDSMLADKNEEIDHLKEQLSKREKQLEALNSLNIEEPRGPIEPKNSARTLSDILSIHSECEDMSEAIRDTPSTNFHHNVSSFRREGHEEQELQKSELLVPPLDLGPSITTTPVHYRHQSMNIDSMMSGLDLKSPTLVSDDGKSLNSTSKVTKPSPPANQKTIQDLEDKLKDIYEELKSKSSTLNKREMELNELKKSLDELRTESKDSIETLTRDKDFYKSQYELSQESEKKIRRDMEEVENYLKARSEELELYQEKIQLNEKILSESKDENISLKKEIKKLEDIISNYEQKLSEKLEELNNLTQIIFEKDITIETVKTRNMEIEDENKHLYEYKTKFEMIRKDLLDNQNEVKRLSEGMNSRDVVIQRLEDMARRSTATSPEDNKDQEIHHLKDLVKEKDKLIQQMTDDSKSLHRELETVHRKMKEPGNVVELRKKLQQEKKYNTELTKMVTKLSKELEVFKEDSRHPEDLEDMVQRELNLSADLDKKIMDAIESESEDLSHRKIELHSCNSLTIKPVEQDLEKIMEQYLDIRAKLKAQSKLNNELTHHKNELEIKKEMLQCQISEYESRILQLKSDFERECKRNNNLSEELSSKKAAMRNLEVQVKKEKTAHHNSQMEDSNMIEMLRIKLTSSLNTEQQLRDNNLSLREKNKMLTSQLSALKFQIESRAGVPPLEIPSPDPEIPERISDLERENQDLRSTLQSLESERNKYKKDLEIAIEETEKLLSTLAIVEGDKDHLEIIQRRLKDTIKTREEEIEWLQRRIKGLTDAEDKRQQQRSDDEHELKSLRQEIKNVREVMHDWQIDTDQMSQQLRVSLSERAQLTQVVMALRKSEEELNKKVNEARAQEEKLQDVINELRGQLLAQRSLEERDVVDGQFVQSISELRGKLERYAHEKTILHEKLMKERAERERAEARVRELEVVTIQRNLEDSDLSNKFQKLYGKYIRVDSKRKALAFQKRYLLCVIGGYQVSEENTLSVLAKLTNSEKSFVDYGSARRRKFRSVALVVVSIIRMKWLVGRWRQGVRRNAARVVGDADKSFLGIQRGLGHSPPVREKRANGGVNYEHYLERISHVQETLGLAMGAGQKRDG